MKKVIIGLIFGLTMTGPVVGKSTPRDIVASFGEEMSAWCKTSDIAHREKVEALCDGVKKCRVEDKIHSDYQTQRGLTDFDTFFLDSYLNMFETMIDDLDYTMSDITVEKEDPIENLTFLKAKLRLTGAINEDVEDLFLVRDGKISGIFKGQSGLSIKHLNGSLLKALENGKYTVNYSNGNYCKISNEAGHQGLIDFNGNIVIPCIWDKMDFHGGDFACGYNYKSNQFSQQYDLRRGGISCPIYRINTYKRYRQEPYTFTDGYAVVVNKENKYGLLSDTDSTYTVDYFYDMIYPSSEGYAVGQYQGTCYIINPGNDYDWKRVDDKYSVAGSFHNGLARVKDKDTEKWGFINSQGEIVIACQFDDVEDFSGGVSVVGRKDKPSKEPYRQSYSHAMIDTQGNLLTDYDFRFIAPCKNGYCEAMKEVNGYVKSTIIDIHGEPIPGFDWSHDGLRYFRENYARFEDNEKSGYLNTEGRIIIPAVYDYGSDFYNGVACVGKKEDGAMKYGYINKEGIVIIPIIYDNPFWFYNGIAQVNLNGIQGLIDLYGNTTVTTSK